MTVLYITEYCDTFATPEGTSIALEPNNADQTVAIGVSSASSNAFQNNTNLIRLHTDSICSVAFGTAPTAAATTRRLAANQTEYFAVPLGKSYKVAVITNT